MMSACYTVAAEPPTDLLSHEFTDRWHRRARNKYGNFNGFVVPSELGLRRSRAKLYDLGSL